ncbi:MAG: hypothetical protein K2K55_04655, partial [Duncaniella sp.]|nr:hypothetical protein [Duncaniella sp.]
EGGTTVEDMLKISVHRNPLIKLTLPKQPLSRISSTLRFIGIKGLQTGKLTLFSNHDLDLDNCQIDSLMLTASGSAKMKFKDSLVGYMRLRMEDNFLKINCCDSTGLIRKLDFITREGKKTDLYLNDANIDTLKWNPEKPTQLTIRTKHPINIVK